MPTADQPEIDQPEIDQPEIDQLSYEEVLQRLEEAVERLESGGLAMNEAIEAYERGAALAAQAQRLLDAAEQRIRELREAEE